MSDVETPREITPLNPDVELKEYGIFDDDADDDDEDWRNFELSISDRLQVFYGNMDRACQTDFSEIINLKEMAQVLATVVSDLSTLKKSLYFAKLTLQAEYDGRLQEVALELYSRVNRRIAEIEELHKERIQVVRKSYKMQLANALTKLSRDYHNFYGNRDAMTEESHKKKLKEMQKHQEMMRKNEVAQKEMFEMLKMQMEEAKAREIDTPSRKSSGVSITLYMEEIDELKKSLKEYECRIDYLDDMLDETSMDNKKLTSNVEMLTTKLREEEKKTTTLNKMVESLIRQIERESEEAEKRLAEREEALKREMKNKLSTQDQKNQEEKERQLEMVRKFEADRLKSQKRAEENRIKKLMEQHEQTKVIITEAPQDTDITYLQLIEKRQRAEIARLNKELERFQKLYQMRVKVLNEHIHALKDEMFLRTTLQRQSAKMTNATLTYVKCGSRYIPVGINPDGGKVIRKLQVPNIVGAPTEEDLLNAQARKQSQESEETK